MDRAADTMASRVRMSFAAVRAVFAHAAQRRAVVAFACTGTADWAVTVAVGVIAFEDGGAAAVGLIALARMLPSAVAVPVFAAVADRIRRERLIAGASIVQGVAIGLAGLLLVADVDLVAVYALVVVSTVANTILRPAHSSLLPSLCTTTSELASATVATGLLGASAALAGPVITGVLFAVAGPDAVFGVAFVLCVVATIALLRIRYDAIERPPTKRPHVLREVVEGIQIVGPPPRAAARVRGRVRADLRARRPERADGRRRLRPPRHRRVRRRRAGRRLRRGRDRRELRRVAPHRDADTSAVGWSRRWRCGGRRSR